MSFKNPESENSVEDSIETIEPGEYKVILHNDNYTTMEFSKSINICLQQVS